MTSPDKTKLRILQKSLELFSQKGFTKVPMDELASSLSISKKTLYKSFSGKEEIVRGVIQWIGDETAEHISSIVQDEALEFPDKIGLIFQFMTQQLTRVGKFFFDDLKRAMPEVWEEVQELREKRVNDNFGRIFNEAKQHGWFRNDVDPHLVLLIFLHSIQNIVSPEILTTLPYSASQVMDTIKKVIFEGVLTDEGRLKYLQTFEKQTL
jgi:AcrR family transcriptional regulator